MIPSRLGRRNLLILTSTLLATGPSLAAESPPPPLGPGLALFLETVAPPAARDARVARMAALFVPAGTPPSTFLPPGPFRARFEGALEVDLRDDFIFSLEGNGAASLEIEGKMVLETRGADLSKAEPASVELRKGRNRLLLRYESPPQGDAALRLYWSSADFQREPVPAAVLSHDPTEPFLKSRLAVRAGRALAVEKRCFRCHRDAEAPGATRDAVAPIAHDFSMDLSTAAPDLAGAGSRFSEGWMASWIDDPRRLRPDAAMPRLFRGPGGALDPRAADIAAFLATLREPGDAKAETSPPAAPEKETLQRGARLFADLGCSGCHARRIDASMPAGIPRRVPLALVPSKWTLDALAEFLRAPARRFPSIAMPDFLLEEREARDLAAFLYFSSPEAPPLPRSKTPDADRGRKLLEETGCLACHPAPPGLVDRSRPPLRAPLFAPTKGGGVLHGCLDPKGDEKSPDLALSEAERGALGAFLAEPAPLAHEESPTELAARELVRLRCFACHARDGRADHLSSLADEIQAFRKEFGVEEKILSAPAAGESPPASGATRSLDQSRPQLTWTGEKLRAEWMGRFIAGEGREPIRPWLASRMPALRSRGALIARGLAMEHGFSPEIPPEPPADPERARLGRKLIRKEGGFSCVSCHDLGRTKAQGAFEVPGINFAFTAERLRRDFFHRWMLNPVRVAPETRMPQFADDTGRSPFADVEGGDARKQFEDLWQFLLTGRKVSLEE